MFYKSKAHKLYCIYKTKIISLLLISSGNAEVDRMVQILLSNPVCVAGFLACFLDNTIPGMPDSLHGQVVVPSERTLHE